MGRRVEGVGFKAEGFYGPGLDERQTLKCRRQKEYKTTKGLLKYWFLH
jgi:hypothetical protein